MRGLDVAWKTARRAPLMALAALATLMAGGAVYADEIPLRQVLAPVRDGFAALLLVEVGTPATTPRDFPVAGRPGKACDPYPLFEWHATVKRVVRASPRDGAPALAAGSALRVVPANIPMLVELTRRACLEGVSKSPIYERHDGVEPTAGATLLLVASWTPAFGWLERVDGAWLPAAELPRLEAWLAGPDSPLPEHAPEHP